MIDISRTMLYDKIKALANNMSGLNIDRLFNATQVKTVARGERILVEGKVCKHIYFVESGCLRLFTTRDGIEINTDFIFENNFTTNLKSLRSSNPSDLTIEAYESSVVYVFEKDALLALYKESSEIESFGRKLLEQLLMAQEDHANLFKLYAPRERYEYILENYPQIIQRVSLTQLASYLGIARETLSRIRKPK
jgi:CRP-like cAMP-binding protein